MGSLTQSRFKKQIEMIESGCIGFQIAKFYAWPKTIQKLNIFALNQGHLDIYFTHKIDIFIDLKALYISNFVIILSLSQIFG